MISARLLLGSGISRSNWLATMPRRHVAWIPLFVPLSRQKHHLVEYRVTTMATLDPQLFFRLKSAHYRKQLKFKPGHIKTLTILHSEVISIVQFRQ